MTSTDSDSISSEINSKKNSKKKFYIVLILSIVIVLSLTIGLSLYFCIGKKTTQTPPLPPPKPDFIDKLVDDWVAKLDDDCDKLKNIKNEIKAELKNYIKKYPDEEKCASDILIFNEELYNFCINDAELKVQNGCRYDEINNAIENYKTQFTTVLQIFNGFFKDCPQLWSFIFPLPEPNKEFPGHTLLICVWKLILVNQKYGEEAVTNIDSITEIMLELQENGEIDWFDDPEYERIKEHAFRIIKFYIGHVKKENLKTKFPDKKAIFRIQNTGDYLYQHLNPREQAEFKVIIDSDSGPWFTSEELDQIGSR